MPIPGDLQSAMFKKIFSYDKTLQSVGEITVFIVGAEKDDQTVQELVKAFKNEGAFPAVIGAVPLEGPLPPSSVVYLFPEADLEVAKQVCGESGVLTISGDPSLVEQGHVSVAIGENGGKAEIIVNLPRLKEEGHELSAQLLKLARIIQ
jgi:hypothetical protein